VVKSEQKEFSCSAARACMVKVVPVGTTAFHVTAAQLVLFWPAAGRPWTKADVMFHTPAVAPEASTCAGGERGKGEKEGGRGSPPWHSIHHAQHEVRRQPHLQPRHGSTNHARTSASATVADVTEVSIPELKSAVVVKVNWGCLVAGVEKGFNPMATATSLIPWWNTEWSVPSTTPCPRVRMFS
jgi:hypothetical protein